MTNSTPVLSKPVNGLPGYSIEGGICNNHGCLGICRVIDPAKRYWICLKCASKKVEGFVNAFVSLGGPV